MLIRTLFCLLGLLLATTSVRADPASALITIAEGPAQLIRAVNRAPAALGNRVRPGDILQVDAAGFLRVETADGLRVDLGPGARVLWLPPRLGAKGSAKLVYLAAGWLKVSAPAQRGATPLGILSPDLELDDYGTVVVHQVAGKSQVFAETGPLKGAERIAGAVPPLALKAGEFLARSGERKGAVQPRPSAEFIAGLIRPFMDAIPQRHAEILKREAAVRSGPQVGYEDIQPWLQAEAPLRQALMQRWRPLVSEPAFRAALAGNMRLHPEWDPILFPERHRASDAPAPASSGASTPAIPVPAPATPAPAGAGKAERP